MPELPARSENGNWFLAGCFSLFTLPFLIAGIGVLNAGIRALHRGQEDALVLLVVGTLFSAMSIGIAAMIWFGMRSAIAAVRLRSANPAQPWLWREDWAARRVREAAPAGGLALWMFALMWNAITVPMLLVLYRQFPRNPAVAILFLFAAIGLALLAGAAYSALRRRKFGRSFCDIDLLPIAPGRTFRGEIEHHGTEAPEGGYELVLRCVERVVVGRGKGQSVTEDVLWETSQRISAGVAAPTPVGMRVPFSFDIPADARSTDLRTPSDTIVWRLVVTAPLPGIDYRATFELPLFGADDQAVHHDEAARRELPPSSRVSVTPLPTGGIELRVGPQRDASAASIFIVFAVIWFGVIAVMWRLGAPQAVAAFFSLFGLIVLWMAIDYFAGVSILRADSGGLSARREVAAAGRTRTLDAASIESITSKVGGHSGNRPTFDVEVRLRGGTSRSVARYLHSRADADAIAAKLLVALGR